MCLLLAGCGSNDGSNSGSNDGNNETDMEASSFLEIKKDGSVIETIVEDFSGEYYEEEELKNFIMSEVADFNNTSDLDKISVEQFENKDGVIHVKIVYPSVLSYAAYNSDEYNSKTLFFGTVAEAYDAGMELDVTLTDGKDQEKTIGKEELLGMGDSHILISEEPVAVKVFGRIAYVSENVSVTGKNKAVMNIGEEGDLSDRWYIVF